MLISFKLNPVNMDTNTPWTKVRQMIIVPGLYDFHVMRRRSILVEYPK